MRTSPHGLGRDGDVAGASSRSAGLPAELRVGDLETFLAVERCGSLAAAARERGVTTSQVSKAVGRLERELQIGLIARSAHGTRLTDEARRMLPHLHAAVRELSALRGGHAPAERRLAVAAPSYLLALFLPVIAESQPQLRVGGLELPPALLRPHTGDGLFDASLAPGRARLPPAWQATALGEMRRALLARPALARRLGRGPVPVERLRELPFIGPSYTVNGQFVPVSDDCPLPVGERRQGHTVPTIAVALEVAQRTDQLVFGPLIAARRLLDERRLVEIPVEGWRVVDPLLFACDTRRLLAREHRTIVAALRRALARLEG
jgi:DNA-binding transcriptional LysR family regulator